MMPPRYRIRFKHTQEPTKVRTLATAVAGVPENVTAATVCVLEDADRRPLGRGYAFCSPRDTFSREVGRRVALAEALAEAFPYEPGAAELNIVLRQERAYVWNLYFSRNESRFDPRRKAA